MQKTPWEEEATITREKLRWSRSTILLLKKMLAVADQLLLRATSPTTTLSM